jgi:hypothetical protein
MRADRIVMTAPALDDDPRFTQGVEDLAIERFGAQARDASRASGGLNLSFYGISYSFEECLLARAHHFGTSHASRRRGSLLRRAFPGFSCSGARLVRRSRYATDHVSLLAP